MADAVDTPGALEGRAGPDEPTVTIDNRTTLPDAEVREAIMAHWAENASMQFGQPSTFQMYATSGGTNMLNRSPFTVPANIIEEIRLARSVAETDDDVAAIIGSALSVAYGDGMQNQHTDEKTMHLFNRIDRDANMDNRLKELHREYLIAGQVNTLSLYTRSRLDFTPSGTEEKIRAQLSTPLIGVIPAEDVRVISNDIFGNAELAYDPPSQSVREWLESYFSASTSPAVKNKMRTEEPILAAIFLRKVDVPWNDGDSFIQGKTLFVFNPRMLHRTCMAKGASPYPRPPITSNFALLEAKRLLNIMDYSLLQGGTNYIVVARQGSDKLPAQQPEIDNLTDIVRTSARTGVLVGDHRLTVDIITPDLTELLNPAKRKLIGRKLAMAILRIPEQVTGDPGTEGAKQEAEFTQRTITSDRRDIKRHVERNIYDEIVKRNASTFTKGPPTLWFPKIILTGVADFFTSVMKARDRGDLPREAGVELLGYDYDAQVAQRKREKERGDDEIMAPVGVPFSASGDPEDPNAPPPGGPGGEGRPPGSSRSNGRPGGPPEADRVPQPAVRRQRGEPVRAVWSPEEQAMLRVGELTTAVLDEYPDRTVGRITTIERESVNASDVRQAGPVTIVPVNPGYAVDEIRAFRLADGLSMVVGQREDKAIVAKALCFREPQFDSKAAVETALRWGFVTDVTTPGEEEAVVPEHQPSMGEQVIAALQNPETVAMLLPVVKEVFASLTPNVTVVMPGEQEMEIIRDENGAIVGKRPKPLPTGE